MTKLMAICLLCAFAHAHPSDDILKLRSNPNNRPLLMELSELHSNDPFYLQGLNAYWPRTLETLKVEVPQDVTKVMVQFWHRDNWAIPQDDITIQIVSQKPLPDAAIEVHSQSRQPLAPSENRPREGSYLYRIRFLKTPAPFQPLRMTIRWDQAQQTELDILVPAALRTSSTYYYGKQPTVTHEIAAIRNEAARPLWFSSNPNEPVPASIVGPYILSRTRIETFPTASPKIEVSLVLQR